MIEVKDFSFRYQGSDQMVLDHINLIIHPGEWLLIRGLSGCGKSTLALALAGFLGKVIPGHCNGEILIDQRNIQELEAHEISERIFLVQQNPENQFCTLTVKDELAFGLENRLLPENVIKQRILTALAAVQATSLFDRRLDELSGGQQQKIAIATALALQPDVLILDEPTSNLDPDSLQNLINVLDGLRSSIKLSVVIIEHRKEILSDLISRHLEIREAKLVETKAMTFDKTPKNNLKSQSALKKDNREILLEVDNLSVNYDGVKALGINRFALHSGEIISLMGSNGSGKTTLLLSLLGLIESNCQSKKIFGRVFSGKIPKYVMASVGLAFQNPDHQIFCDSVKKEVCFGPENYGSQDISAKWIHEILETFGFCAMTDKHPFLLSFGQKGRLNLASILSYQPRILLLDEVFIGQDADNVLFILNTVREYVDERGAGAIFVNHMPNPVLNYSDRLIFLENGKMVIDCIPINAFREFELIGKSNWLGVAND